ncbi:MAG: phosphoglucosamine mutase [Opitutaceae bacterium]|nr:phosphoglucosamine mutase [Opitutaceae bacterium]
MKRLYFGTDGVRGRFGDAVMNPDFVRKLANAAGRHMAGKLGTGAKRALIGRDTRASGPVLEAAVAEGLAAAGWDVGLLGVVPTPAVSLAVRELGAQLGVVITASHNPADDNGVKFFAGTGFKLPDSEEVAIEALLDVPGPAVARGEIGAVEDGKARYIAQALTRLPAGALRGWKIVLDTANGATCETTREVLAQLGAELDLLGNAPDGRNINAGVGSEHPQQLAARVLATGARLGIAHDGDGDRVVFCDETGSALDGDEVMTFLALGKLRRGDLPGGTLVLTVQSNLGVDAALAAAGGRVVRTDVGDRYVSEALQREGAGLGGESSGHFIFPRVSPAGDGLLAALAVLRVMRDTGQPLSELRQALKKFPQAQKALKLVAKPPLASLPGVQRLLREAEAALGGTGRVMIRYSGTEPKVRILVEAQTEAAVQEWFAKSEAALRAELQVVG